MATWAKQTVNVRNSGDYKGWYTSGDSCYSASSGGDYWQGDDWHRNSSWSDEYATIGSGGLGGDHWATEDKKTSVADWNAGVELQGLI